MPRNVTRITTDFGELDLVEFRYGPIKYPSGSVILEDYFAFFKPGSDYSEPPLGRLPLDTDIKTIEKYARTLLERRDTGHFYL
ncbi:MAG: hypothetical protein HYW22_00325 [Candidatus Aenigmarchaeota archaeon]|nr:hypothetical protein [Candidatus Aenigmarchaeota archaeon]